MAQEMYVELQVEGFEDPFWITVNFEDPILGFEKMGLLKKTLTMKARIKGLESKPVVIRTEPPR